MDLLRVFQFLKHCQQTEKRSALVTVCAVEGASMRNPGTHIGVCEDGSFAGSLSGGCIENAVVAEARDAICDGKSRIVRFGAGSPYVDLKLPCGGGLDLHFQPLLDCLLVDDACKAISARKPFSISLSHEGADLIGSWRPSEYDPLSGRGIFAHWPRTRILIVGHGAGVQALAGLAQSMDCEVEALTPDERIETDLRQSSIPVRRLTRTSETEVLQSDPWTAIVFLFHDHDWETELMRRALQLPHFYIGAMGGRQAHATRCEALLSLGVSEERIATIHAPIGLFHSSRDPQTLALSALGEIIRAYQNAEFENPIE